MPPRYIGAFWRVFAIASRWPALYIVHCLSSPYPSRSQRQLRAAQLFSANMRSRASSTWRFETRLMFGLG
jgi:hypothetical protein